VEEQPCKDDDDILLFKEQIARNDGTSETGSGGMHIIDSMFSYFDQLSQCQKYLICQG